MRVIRSLLAATLAGMFASSAAGADLLQAWQAASRNDREFAVALAARTVADPRREQAAALWRPNVGATLAAGLGTSETSVREDLD